jgi:hypothetical protein
MTVQLHEVDSVAAGPPDAPADAGSRGRRWFLGTAGLTALTTGAALVAPGAAQAATRAKVKRVTKLVAVRWKYDKKTKRTKVTKARRKKVTVKFRGAKVYEKNSHGKWERVPYVWNKRKRALVYSHLLHKQLIAAERRHAKPKPPADPKLSSVGPYVNSSFAWHLARRASYGPTPALVEQIRRQGLQRWLDQQLSPSSIKDTTCDRMLARLGEPGSQMMPVGSSIRLVNDALRDGSYRGAPIYDYQQRQLAAKAHVVRAMWSERHLLTVMEDLWGNHFNVPTFGNRVAESREHLTGTIRSRAFGRFSDLLIAVTLHPAMLNNLNNRDSDKDHPNENLGRELLELHTVGVDAPYGETGVVNSARILTGLSVSSDSAEFMYKDWMHWTGPVKVLGFSDSNRSADGQAVARRYLDYLAHHKSTARQVCRKLAVRFVSDAPSDALVDKLAAVYLANDTRIAPVLRALFASSAFAGSAGDKTQRPFERLVGTTRILGFRPVLGGRDKDFDYRYAVNAIYGRAGDAGHAPFGWGAPNGYPDTAAAWSSTAATLQSWNNRIGVLSGWYPNTQYFENNDLAALLPYSTSPWGFPDGYTHGQLVQHMSGRLFGRSLPSAHLAAVCEFLGVAASRPLRTYATEVPAAAGWALNQWIALLLDSPYGLAR